MYKRTKAGGFKIAQGKDSSCNDIKKMVGGKVVMELKKEKKKDKKDEEEPVPELVKDDPLITDDLEDEDDDDLEEDEEWMERCSFPEWVVGVGNYRTITQNSRYEFSEHGDVYHRSTFSSQDQAWTPVSVNKCRDMVEKTDEMAKFVVKVTTSDW